MDNLQVVQYACLSHSSHQGQNGNLWTTWSDKLPTEPSHGTQPYSLAPASFPDFLSSHCFLFPYHVFALPRFTSCLALTGKFSTAQLLCLSHGGVLRKASKAQLDLKSQASRMIISVVEWLFPQYEGNATTHLTHEDYKTVKKKPQTNIWSLWILPNNASSTEASMPEPLLLFFFKFWQIIATFILFSLKWNWPYLQEN